MKDDYLTKISRFFPPGRMSKIEDDSPLFKAEKNILIARKDKPKGKIFYQNFNSNLENYLLKVPTSIAKKSVNTVYQRDLVYVGRNERSAKGGIIGAVYTPKNRLAAIVLDSAELDIDIISGETDQIDSCFYAIYHQVVRASVIINERQIIKDEEVHKLVCRYMIFLILRLLGSNVLLNDKQKAFLEVVVKYFYIRFMLQYHHSMARETALMSIDDEYKDEADSLMPTLKRYNSMKDIFKAMVDYQIVNDSPSLLIVKALNKFKPLVFYSLISSLDYIVALAVTSQYPADFLSGALINNDVQKKLEKKIDKYIRMIKFDVNAMKKI